MVPARCSCKPAATWICRRRPASARAATCGIRPCRQRVPTSAFRSAPLRARPTTMPSSRRYLASAEFAEEFADSSGQYRNDLIAYMHVRGYEGTDFQEALAAFRDLSLPPRRRCWSASCSRSCVPPVVGGAAGTDQQDSSADSRRYELLPGRNPDIDAGEANPYAGDISLYFSRVYTLAGGDISLFAPGGEINAGLASAARAYGLNERRISSSGSSRARRQRQCSSVRRFPRQRIARVRG